MNRIAMLLVSTAAALVSAACSNDPAKIDDSGPTWRDNPYVFGKSAVPVDGVPAPGSAKLVFLRPRAGGSTEVIANLYVDDRYLSSLMAGAYVVNETCAGPARLSAVFDDASLRHLGKYDADRNIELEPGKTYFFSVANKNSSGATEITPVDGSQLDLSTYTVQTHPVPRVQRDCSAVARSGPVYRQAVSEAAVAPLPLASPAPAMPAVNTTSSALCPASERGANVTKAPAGLGTETVAELRCAIEAWRRDWESGDFSAYREHYDTDASGSVAHGKGWDAFRTRRLRNTNIVIKLGETTLSGSGALVSSAFFQDYKSTQYRDKGIKHLTWKREPGGWKIVAEHLDRS